MADKVEIDLIVEAISKGFDKLGADLKGVGDKAKQGEQGTKGLSGSLANLKTAAMGAAVVVGGALVAGLVKSVMAASDAEEAMSKFNVVFKDIQGGPAAFAAEVDAMAAATGRSKNELYGMVAGLGDLFQPLGFGVEAAGDLSLQMTQLAIDLSSFNNMSMDEALTRLQGTLIGSHENALAFGVVINENTLKAELAANGWDKLTGSQLEQAKVQARLNLLMAGTTAAQGDAERTADGFANQTRALQANMQDLAVEIGQEFLPAATELIGILRNFANDAAPAAVAAAKFLASGLKAGADLMGGYGDEVDEITKQQIAQAKSTEQLAQKWNNYADQLSGFKQYGAIITNTDEEIRSGIAEIGVALAKSTNSFDDFSAAINETEYGETILLNAISKTTGVTYESIEAFYDATNAIEDAANAAKVAASVTEYMTDAVKDDTVVVEKQTVALADNYTEATTYARAGREMGAAQVQAAKDIEQANREIEEQEERARAAADAIAVYKSATGDYATQAMNAGEEGVNLNEVMYQAADAAGAEAGILVGLALAQGTVTEAKAEAILKEAAMIAKAQEYGAAIAAGTMTINDAVTGLQNFGATLDDNTLRVDTATGSVSLFDDAVIGSSGAIGSLQTRLDNFDPSSAIGATQAFIDKLNSIPREIDVNLNVHGGEGGQGVGHGGYQNPEGMAAGGLVTGGIPGRDSVPTMLMPGERVLTTSQNQMFEQLVRTLAQQKGSNTMNMYVTATDGGANATREYNYMRAVMGV